MAFGLIIYAFIIMAVYFDISRILNRYSLKDRCQSIFNPFSVFRIMILYLVLFLMGGSSRMKERTISFAISFVATTFLVFAFMTLFAG